MKYSCRYNNNIKDFDNFDEISLIYINEDIKPLVKFIQEHPNKRIVIHITDFKKFQEFDQLPLLKALNVKYPEIDLTLCFDYFQEAKHNISDEVKSFLIQVAPLKFYFNHKITTWDALHMYLNLGVSDILISEQLGFNLQGVRTVCDKYGATVRAIPNVAQSSAGAIDALNKFFIRPEDIPYCEKYIDILEFWGPDSKQNTYCKIYKNKEWFGDISEIIFDLNTPIDNRTIAPIWFKERANCDRRCMKGQKCRMCYTILSLSKTLHDKNFIIRNDKTI